MNITFENGIFKIEGNSDSVPGVSVKVNLRGNLVNLSRSTEGEGILLRSCCRGLEAYVSCVATVAVVDLMSFAIAVDSKNLEHILTGCILSEVVSAEVELDDVDLAA